MRPTLIPSLFGTSPDIKQIVRAKRKLRKKNRHTFTKKDQSTDIAKIMKTKKLGEKKKVLTVAMRCRDHVCPAVLGQGNGLAGPGLQQQLIQGHSLRGIRLQQPM